jgi:hypothetical protein
MKKRKSMGIICRGKSLDMLEVVKNKFNTCFIVNDFKKELELYGQYLRGKQIRQMVSADHKVLLTQEQYYEYKITNAVFTWTHKHLQPGHKVIAALATENYPNQIKNVKFIFLPEVYYYLCNYLKNSGVLCTYYVSDTFKPSEIWIVGLDFYSCDYATHGLTETQLYRVKHEDLCDTLFKKFVDIVDKFSNIQYYLATRYKVKRKLPKNLEILSDE